MRFALNDDQTTFLTVLEQMTASRDAAFHNAVDWGRFEWSGALDSMIEENGFYDAAAEKTLGPVTAAAMVYEVARLPVTVECAASAMLRAVFAPDLPRPFAVVEGDSRQATRFLPVAKTVLHIGKTGIRAALCPGELVSAVESLFAYPMGTVDLASLEWTPLDCDPVAVTNSWRVATAAELTGTLKGALDSVVEHVRDREQFGRPIGSFQGVQHRLATAAVDIEGARWLTLRAAQGLQSCDAAMALGYAQKVSTRIIYDLHQFMGAMGLTLEHPLHRWTYRARLLRSALGGAGGNFRAFAEQRWGAT